MEATFGKHVPAAKSAQKEYIFVEVAKTGRVINKKHLHNVRKHIMKDIGLSRRKNNKFTEEVPPKEPQKVARKEVTRIERAVEASSPDYSSPSRSDILTLGDWSLGSGRMDPFACYPIAVDHALLFLVDHGTPPSPHFHPEY